MQLAALEFAKNVCQISNATSMELVKDRGGGHEFIIHLMEEQKKVLGKGGTMRLGSYDCQLVKNSLAQRVYNKTLIKERHRHRFEFNNQFKSLFEKQGVVFSGLNGEKNLVEILEIPNHPFFLGVQFHPEFSIQAPVPSPPIHPFHSILPRAKKLHQPR